jgi:hypothetical protein
MPLSKSFDGKTYSTGVVEVYPIRERFALRKCVGVNRRQRLAIVINVFGHTNDRRETTRFESPQYRGELAVVDVRLAHWIWPFGLSKCSKDIPQNLEGIGAVHGYPNHLRWSHLPVSGEARRVAVVFRFLFKLIRAAMLAALGTALAAKFLLESNAEPATEEIDLISIFEGKHLVSSAAPFYGGHVTSMFGGVLLDLRTATPAPTGIHLDLAVIMGGVSLVVPEGWRVKASEQLTILGGGFSDETRTTSEEDVPTVTIKGFIAMGGFQATTKSAVEGVAK